MLPKARNEATMTSNSRLICMADEPMMPGSISFMIRRTPESRQPQRGQRSNLSRSRNGNCNSSCAMPAISTPQARAMAGTLKESDSHRAAPIRLRLSSTGVKAGRAKRP